MKVEDVGETEFLIDEQMDKLGRSAATAGLAKEWSEHRSASVTM